MSDLQWVQIRSWHIVLTHTRAENGWKTVCGRYATVANSTDTLPIGKSCETCLRYTVTASDNAAPVPEDDGSTQSVETLP